MSVFRCQETATCMRGTLVLLYAYNIELKKKKKAHPAKHFLSLILFSLFILIFKKVSSRLQTLPPPPIIRLTTKQLKLP